MGMHLEEFRDVPSLTGVPGGQNNINANMLFRSSMADFQEIAATLVTTSLKCSHLADCTLFGVSLLPAYLSALQSCQPTLPFPVDTSCKSCCQKQHGLPSCP